MTQATCATCRWWSETSGIDPWTGKAWTSEPPLRFRDRRVGVCNRMPRAESKKPEEWCGEHPAAHAALMDEIVLNLGVLDPSARAKRYEALLAGGVPVNAMRRAEGLPPLEVHGAKPSKIGD